MFILCFRHEVNGKTNITSILLVYEALWCRVCLDRNKRSLHARKFLTGAIRRGKINLPRRQRHRPAITNNCNRSSLLISRDNLLGHAASAFRVLTRRHEMFLALRSHTMTGRHWIRNGESPPPAPVFPFCRVCFDSSCGRRAIILSRVPCSFPGRSSPVTFCWKRGLNVEGSALNDWGATSRRYIE